jgi:hypothetical protein
MAKCAILGHIFAFHRFLKLFHNFLKVAVQKNKIQFGGGYLGEYNDNSLKSPIKLMSPPNHATNAEYILSVERSLRHP